MQTWITDKDFYKSASNLNRQHLQAQIYEGIHILASLLDVNDKLVNPKRNVKNHPASKLWVGYEFDLLAYIYCHLDYWFELGYKSDINEKNYWLLQEEIGLHPLIKQLHPTWITDELIQTHRSRLIQKEIEKEKELCLLIRDQLEMYEKFRYTKPIIALRYYENHNKLIEKSLDKNNYHYRNLWPNTPRDLKMRYDWVYVDNYKERV